MKIVRNLACLLALGAVSTGALAQSAPPDPNTQIDQLVQQYCAAKPSRCDRYKNHGEKLKEKCASGASNCQSKIDRFAKHAPT
jgi:hypothetical protein